VDWLPAEVKTENRSFCACNNGVSTAGFPVNQILGQTEQQKNEQIG
jgi:hypothetical protein